jgi:serine/threonine protein kinase
MPAHINARYRIIKTLGENAQGSIFLVEDMLYDNLPAALKTFHSGGMDDVFLNNLRDEFSTLSKFMHPNIARVYDVGTIHTTDLEGYAGSLFFTLEYCEGSDLIAATEAADEETICGLVFQIAHALEYIHRHGLIHSDIKPANIIVSDAGQGGGRLVKIIDFGFATTGIGSNDQPIRGTLEYMAPEVLRGDAHDHRVDLYALGVSLYEVIARRTPFHGATPTETIKQHLSSPVPPLPDPGAVAPGMMTELASWLLQKNPDDRPGSAAEVINFLQVRHPEEFFLQSVLESVPLHVLIGRDPEAEHLYSCLHDDLTSPTAEPFHHPSVSVITGESGIGKSSLLHEVQLRAQTAGLVFFNTLCFARNARQYEPMLTLLLDQIAYLRAFGRMGEQLLEKHGEFLKRAFDSDAGTFLLTNVQQLDDPEKQLHFVDLWSQFFFDITSISRYAVWVDNIDDADESTIELLVYLLRSAHRHRVKFFISGIDNAKIARLVRSIDEATVDTIDLAPLHAGAVQELMSLSLNVPAVPMSLAETLTAKFGGSPSVLLEFSSQYMTVPREERAAAVERDLLSSQEQGKF